METKIPAGLPSMAPWPHSSAIWSKRAFSWEVMLPNAGGGAEQDAVRGFQVFEGADGGVLLLLQGRLGVLGSPGVWPG